MPRNCKLSHREEGSSKFSKQRDNPLFEKTILIDQRKVSLFKAKNYRYESLGKDILQARKSKYLKTKMQKSHERVIHLKKTDES